MRNLRSMNSVSVSVHSPGTQSIPSDLTLPAT